MAGVDKVLYLLKTRGEQTAQTLAELLQLTSMGARKHLEALQQRGLVCSEDRPAGKGRPARYWQLTDAGHARFPDRHGELTAQLLVLLRETAGEAAVEALITAREQQAMTVYRAGMAAAANLPARLQRLAQMRSDEGYMAELTQDGDSWLLIENHSRSVPRRVPARVSAVRSCSSLLPCCRRLKSAAKRTCYRVASAAFTASCR